MKLLALFFTAIFIFTFSLRANESHSGVTATTTTTTHAEVKNVSGPEALSMLLGGNERFTTDHMEHGHQNEKARSELTAGQKPYAIVISCSDSRVPPEIIFDQGLGQIFVVRSAGEVLSQTEIASVEYAIEHLNTELIVILGHESCGAVKATISTPVGKSSGSVNIDNLISSIRPNIQNVHTQDDTLFIKSGKAQVNGVARTLVNRSRIVRELALKGKITLALGLYSLSSGKVEFWSTGIPIIIERNIPNAVTTKNHEEPMPMPISHPRRY